MHYFTTQCDSRRWFTHCRVELFANNWKGFQALLRPALQLWLVQSLSGAESVYLVQAGRAWASMRLVSVEEQVRWAGKDQVVNRNTANVTVAKGLQV